MLDAILKQFTDSPAASDVMKSLTGAGLSANEATSALQATAEGAAQELGGGGGGGALGALGGMLSGGGASALGGLFGGGGGGGGGALGALGGLLGGGGSSSSSVPPAVTEKVTSFVASKTGMSMDKASMAVGLVLPKLVEFVKSKMG